MIERSVRIGSVRCTFAAQAVARTAIDEWLGARAGTAPCTDPDLAFELVEGPAPRPHGEPIPHRVGAGALWRRDDAIELRTEDDDGGYVDLARSRGRVWVGTHGDARLAVHRCLRPLLFLALGRRGWHGLHAAAVLLDDGAVLLVGSSGAGKSTMSIRWAASGHPLLADDIVFVHEQTLCVAAAPEPPRLDASHARGLGLEGRPHIGGKVTVEVAPRAAGPAPIGLLGLIDPAPAEPGRAAIAPVPAGDAMTALLRAGLLTIDPVQDPSRLATLARLASTCPAVRLGRGADPPNSRGEARTWASTALVT